MGIFSRIKGGISSKANAALDKAIDPAKELDMAIIDLEDGRKKALQELIAYKATAKTLDADVVKFRAKATEWERRAMMAVKAGDDEAAKVALKEKRNAEQEATKIERDKHEAASYAIQLNKSRKEFETKLQILKLRKGTLATQIAAGRSAGGDAFGNDSSVWDKFKAAEDRIDAEVIETEVDAAMRGEESGSAMAAMEFDQKLLAAQRASPGALPVAGSSDALSELKTKMEAAKAAKALAAGPTEPTGESRREEVIVSSSQLGTRPADPVAGSPDSDEALSARLRDLSLVELDALTAGLASGDAQVVIATFADDVADALREARTRIAALRQALGGADPLNVLDLQARQRASDAGQAGALRVVDRLVAQAQAARALSRLADLASGLVGKLFEADRRR